MKTYILNTSRIEGWLLAVNPEIQGPVHVISCIFGSYLPKGKTLSRPVVEAALGKE
jgi:hypothetical protein